VCLLGYSHASLSSQDDNKTASSSTVRVHSDNIQFQTSSPAAILNSSVVDELNLLPVCKAEEMGADESRLGSTKTAHRCLDNDNPAEEDDRKTDDVIRTCVAENDDARICEVRVIKGALGLGFCIDGGKGCATGDRPISVKRLFLGIFMFLLVYFTTSNCSFVLYRLKLQQLPKIRQFKRKTSAAQQLEDSSFMTSTTT